MSDPFAVSAVTAAFAQLLLGVREEPTLTGATVTIGPPDRARSASATGQQLNLFLYEVLPNCARRNADLPRRDADGRLVRRPALALDLRYLLTAYGQGDDDADAQHLLAHAMSIVHDQGGLGPDEISAAARAVPALQRADLGGAMERVSLNQHGSTVDDIARLWSLYQTTNYRLSVLYEASAVVVERPHPVRAARPPAQDVGLTADPVRLPVIVSVTPRIAGPGDRLRVLGRNLAGEHTSVRCGPLVAHVTGATDTELTLELPTGLPAGPTTVQVERGPDGAGRGVSSNVAALTVAPRIVSLGPTPVARGAELTVECAPPIQPQQRVALLLGDSQLAALGNRLAPTDRLAFTVPVTAGPGTLLVRLRVDGAESPLTRDADGRYVAPAVTVTP